MSYIANIGDLHLYNRNIRSTLEMPQASLLMLEELYKSLEEHPEIKIINSLGDIQHLTPNGKNAVQCMYEWKQALRKIEELAYTRFMESSVEKVVDRQGCDVTELIEARQLPAFFAIRGNHDFDGEVDFTFYDLLLKEGVIFEPLYIIVDGVQINYHHYNEADSVITKEPHVQKVVGLYHDNIDYPEMPFWMGLTGGYEAVNILNNVDVAIIGHIHKRYEPVRIRTTNGGECLVSVQGAMGRTQFAEGQIRDVGYVSVIDTNDLTQMGVLEVPLMPKEQYFNYNQAVAQQEQRRDLSQFSLNVQHIETDISDVRDEIRNMNIEQEVKELGIQYLTEVIEG